MRLLLLMLGISGRWERDLLKDQERLRRDNTAEPQ
jgi:hypothetical protein